MTDVVQRIINRSLLLRIGAQVVFIIKERTLQGQFLPGSTGTGEYSTTPAPMPWGALLKKVKTQKGMKGMIGSGEVKVISKSKSGKTWVLLMGGYKKFRELAGKEFDHVTLNWTGKTMRNLKILSADTGSASVLIGFDDAGSKRIASYHQELGAGKSRKTHKFLGLTDSELHELGQYVKSAISFQK